MTRVSAIATFGAATAAVSLIGGWWLLPILAAGWVRVAPRPSETPTACALGAALGWAGMLAWRATQGPVGVAARRVGGVFHLPGWAFVLITLAFAAALAGLGAAAARRPRVR